MKEVALACVGGGVKSAINIGVIRALEDLDIKIKAISGASLGSCVAIMRRSSLSYQKREADLWIEVDVKKTKIFDSKDALDYCEQCGYDTVMNLAGKGAFID